MLEQIHATPEDRRVTHTAVSLCALSFGALALADAFMAAAPLEGAVGTLIAAAGASGVAWALKK